jgi:hypothetical protein
MYANKKKVIWVPRLTPVIPATPEVAIRRTGGLWLEASTGKMFERPHLNQLKLGMYTGHLSYVGGINRRMITVQAGP